MTKDKHIEEMAKVIARRSKDFRNPKIAFMTTAEKTAESIYNAGYRKASDLAREIFEEIEKTAKDAIRFCERYGVIPMIREAKISCYKDLICYIAELKKKYTESEDTE